MKHPHHDLATLDTIDRQVHDLAVYVDVNQLDAAGSEP
jgi:hypothetical protein